MPADLLINKPRSGSLSKKKMQSDVKPLAATLVGFLDQEGYTTPHRKDTDHVRNRARLQTKFKNAQNEWDLEAIRADLERLRAEVEDLDNVKERFRQHCQQEHGTKSNMETGDSCKCADTLKGELE